MDPSSLTAKTIGHYEILERLGEGGMGAVYKARDTRLGRLTALKVMRTEVMGDADLSRRFVREAQSASALNHPNILTIYEIDTEDELDYIAMEYIEGDTLDDLIAAGPLPAERALQLTGQVADALVAAHAAGIIHRDLKPSNIMLTGEDRVKVVDFGLAKLSGTTDPSGETAEALTATGAIVGTVPYMSPEQTAGRPLDARSDIFSLGAILYEMLSGRRAFAADSAAATIAAVLRDDPPELGVGTPAVKLLVERCLRKDPAERFQSAAELRAAINSCTGQSGGHEKPSVAVLPFANMSGEKEDDYLCEGLAEEIINALTKVPGLRVIARTSSFIVGRMGLEVREIGEKLGVGTVLEGSVRRSGRRVRVTVQLIDSRDGSHLWSERYDQELTDVLALEDEVADAVASRLRGELAGEKPEPRRPSVDASGHQAYLEGRYHFARATPESLARAAACLERAAEIDPDFAQAFDALAELHWYLGFFGGVPPREAFAQSTWYALRALELDDTLADTHALLGMLRKELDYNWPEVDRELRRARDLNPSSPAVRLRYAISGLMPHGLLEQALAEVDAALQSDPLSLFARWTRGYLLYFSRQREAAIEEGRHMIGLDSGHFLGHWVLGMGRELSGELGGAVEALERANQLSGGIPFTQGFLALAYGKAGRSEEARGILEGLAQTAKSRYIPASALALCHVGLREWDEVFRWFDEAIQQRDPVVVPTKSYPFLDPVRDDPRYEALLKKLKLLPMPRATPSHSHVPGTG